MLRLILLSITAFGTAIFSLYFHNSLGYGNMRVGGYYIEFSLVFMSFCGVSLLYILKKIFGFWYSLSYYMMRVRMRIENYHHKRNNILITNAFSALELRDLPAIDNLQRKISTKDLFSQTVNLALNTEISPSSAEILDLAQKIAVDSSANQNISLYATFCIAKHHFALGNYNKAAEALTAFFDLKMLTEPVISLLFKISFAQEDWESAVKILKFRNPEVTNRNWIQKLSRKAVVNSNYSSLFFLASKKNYLNENIIEAKKYIEFLEVNNRAILLLNLLIFQKINDVNKALELIKQHFNKLPSSALVELTVIFLQKKYNTDYKKSLQYIELLLNQDEENIPEITAYFSYLTALVLFQQISRGNHPDLNIFEIKDKIRENLIIARSWISNSKFNDLYDKIIIPVQTNKKAEVIADKTLNNYANNSNEFDKILSLYSFDLDEWLKSISYQDARELLEDYSSI